MEKAYKTMSQAGAGSIVIGIITIVTRDSRNYRHCQWGTSVEK